MATLEQTEIEEEANELLKAGKLVCDGMSDIPALYSIAISLKRIADVMTRVPPQIVEMTDEEAAQINENAGFFSYKSIKTPGGFFE